MNPSPTQPVKPCAHGPLLLTVFIIAAGGLLATVYSYYQQQAERIRQAALDQLSSIAEMRVGELAQWHRERLGDARFYQGNADFVRLVRAAIDHDGGDRPAINLANWIRETQASHRYNIVVLDPEGRVCHASDPGALPPPALIRDILPATEVRLIDFYQPTDNRAPRLAIAVPLLDDQAPRAPVATMLWIIDPQDYLYPLIERGSFQHASAQTLLLRRDHDRVTALSPAADGTIQPLEFHQPITAVDQAVVRAVLDADAPIHAPGFAGVDVTAIARPVAGTPWILMTSLARHEIDGPLRQRLHELIFTSLALLAAAAAAIALLWRSQHAHYLRERLDQAEALRATEKRFRLLFNAVPDAVMLLEKPGADQRPGHFVEVNDIACQRLGYTREELLKLRLEDIDSPAERQRIPERAARLLADGQATWEGQHLTKDGRIIPVEINASAIELDHHHLWLAIARDISERKTDQDQLARLNRTLAVSNGINQTILRERDQRALLARACQIAVDEGGFRTVWIGLLSADRARIEPFTHAGQLADYLSGITIHLTAPLDSAGPASVSVRTLAPCIHNKIADRAGIAWADRALRLGLRSCASFPLVVSGQARGMVALYADESNVFAEDEVRLLDDMARNLSLALELNENETRRRHAEDALKTSEQRFRTILENMPGIAVQGFDREQRIIFWNQASTELYGWHPEETLGRRALDLIVPPEQAGELQAGVDAWFNGGPALLPGEFTLRRKDGTPVNVYSGFFLLKNEQGEPELFSLDIDLTARNAAQAELHLLHAALEATPSAWVITNAQGIIQWVNPAFTTLTGYPHEEAIGRTPHLLYSGQQADNFYDNLWATIQAGRIWSGELQNRRRDGSLYHEHMTVAPVRNHRGDITHFVAMKQDITEQKKLEHQLLRAQRMEGIGLLAGGIAHDLNNVLAPILLSVELLRLRFPGPENKSSLDVIETSARRGAGVVRQVLTFARGIDGERVHLRPKDLLREITFIAEETFPRSINVMRKIDDDLPRVLGDPTQLHQILLNLAVNARDAMPTGGTLTLEATTVDITHTYSRHTGEIKPGHYVRLGVEDTGVGIPHDHLDKIFEPFFTTKGVGQGTGLGLAAVFGIVRSHGGFIEVSSEVGKGSRFQVHLPALTREEQDHTPASRPNGIHGDGRGILVCDDEEPIRLITAAVLGNHGFTVYSAMDGAEARQLHAQHRDNIHLALLDIMLPAETGDQIAIALRKASPGLPILFSTGMIGDAGAEKILKEQLRQPNTALLAKPYDEQTLIANVSRLIDHPEHPPRQRSGPDATA